MYIYLYMTYMWCNLLVFINVSNLYTGSKKTLQWALGWWKKCVSGISRSQGMGYGFPFYRRYSYLKIDENTIEVPSRKHSSIFLLGEYSKILEVILGIHGCIGGLHMGIQEGHTESETSADLVGPNNWGSEWLMWYAWCRSVAKKSVFFFSGQLRQLLFGTPELIRFTVRRLIGDFYFVSCTLHFLCLLTVRS